MIVCRIGLRWAIIDRRSRSLTNASVSGIRSYIRRRQPVARPLKRISPSSKMDLFFIHAFQCQHRSLSVLVKNDLFRKNFQIEDHLGNGLIEWPGICTGGSLWSCVRDNPLSLRVRDLSFHSM